MTAIFVLAFVLGLFVLDSLLTYGLRQVKFVNVKIAALQKDEQTVDDLNVSLEHRI